MFQSFAQRVSQLKPSATMALNAKASALKAAGKNVINLTVGEPDFDTPAPIKAAGTKAIQENFTRYTAVDGIPELKQAICAKLKNDNQLEYAPNEVMVSCGAKQVVYNLCQAVLNPSDEAIILAPYWVSYPAMVELAGASGVFVTAGHEQRFKITAEQLAAAITPKTKLVMLNSPSNPSGMAYSAAELKAIGDVLEQHPHVFIMTDDIYEYLLWNGSFSNIVMTNPALKSRTLVVNGASKAYAMTGWRIGYGAGPSALIDQMKKVQSHSTSGTCSIAQKAAVVAINAGKEFLPPMLKAYQERHDLLLDGFSQMKRVDALPSDGTFYLYIGIEKAVAALGLADDIALADKLLEELHIGTVPGTAFGTPGYLRISFATNAETLKHALERLKKLL